VHSYSPDEAATLTTHVGPSWGAALTQLLPFK
jgi:hypothetical protein